MTKNDAFIEINKLQDEYINELIKLINSSDYEMIKQINFTSPTGTGKTKMMAKLINKFPDCYFLITTLSKGQLHLQIKESLKNDCKFENFTVYGNADYKINTKLQAKDILEKIPENTKCIWLRDEGHIRTNKFEELLANKCFKVINFSATNINTDIKCNFTQTMMLRSVNQSCGTPEDAIKKLLEIKEKHKNVPFYNPCGIFRCISGDDALYKQIIDLCKKYNLKYIDITEDTFNMARICEDDNEIDVIINKFKIVEGIDIRRAHVLYMDNHPSNNATTIQVIGRCRRNALLYRNDIDILAPENEELLKNTRECFVYYNVKQMKIDTDLDGELQYAFCNHISCQEIKAGSIINVTNGQLSNGLYVIELENKTGTFTVEKDEETGFNVINPETSFYKKEVINVDDNYIYVPFDRKIHVNNLKYLPAEGLFYNVVETYEKEKQELYVEKDIYDYFENLSKKYTENYISSKIKNICLDNLLKDEKIGIFDTKILKLRVSSYLKSDSSEGGFKSFCYILKEIENKLVTTCGNIKPLRDVFTKDEILLLQNKCIDLKENNATNIYIEQFIKNFIDLKTKFNEIKYKKEKESHLEIDGLFVEKMTKKQGLAYVSQYIKEHKNEESFRPFCELLLAIENKYDAVYWKLSRLCTEEEILKIQLTCIAAKYERFTDSEIKGYLNTIIELRKNFDVNKDIIFSEKVTAVLLQNDVKSILNNEDILDPFTLTVTFPDSLEITKDSIDTYFENIEKKFNSFKKKNAFLVDSSLAIETFLDKLSSTKYFLKHGIIEKTIYNLENLFIDISEEEKFLLDKKCLNKYGFSIPLSITNTFNAFLPYKKIYNDKESAIIGTDLMRQIKINDKVDWVESKSVSAKIGNYNKFSTFISRKYNDKIEKAKQSLPNIANKKAARNNLKLDKRCNSILNYCVEYYSKYLVYGDSFLGQFLIDAQKEAGTIKLDKFILLRACMLKYREMMVRAYGQGVAPLVRNITIETLQKKYENFVDIVINLATKTSKFVLENLYKDTLPENNIDPNLSIKHLAALADFITKDTILDVKVKGYIDEKMIRNVLACYYLSTKRSDLDIKKLIIFDALSENFIVLNV